MSTAKLDCGCGYDVVCDGMGCCGYDDCLDPWSHWPFMKVELWELCAEHQREWDGWKHRRAAFYQRHPEWVRIGRCACDPGKVPMLDYRVKDLPGMADEISRLGYSAA